MGIFARIQIKFSFQWYFYEGNNLKTRKKRVFFLSSKIANRNHYFLDIFLFSFYHSFSYHFFIPIFEQILDIKIE